MQAACKAKWDLGKTIWSTILFLFAGTYIEFLVIKKYFCVCKRHEGRNLCPFAPETWDKNTWKKKTAFHLHSVTKKAMLNASSAVSVNTVLDKVEHLVILDSRVKGCCNGHVFVKELCQASC